jgi:ABC-type transporter Mla subunit MlaD
MKLKVQYKQLCESYQTLTLTMDQLNQSTTRLVTASTSLVNKLDEANQITTDFQNKSNNLIQNSNRIVADTKSTYKELGFILLTIKKVLKLLKK